MLDISVATAWCWYSTQNIAIQEVTPHILQLCVQDIIELLEFYHIESEWL